MSTGIAAKNSNDNANVSAEIARIVRAAAVTGLTCRSTWKKRPPGSAIGMTTSSPTKASSTRAKQMQVGDGCVGSSVQGIAGTVPQRTCEASARVQPHDSTESMCALFDTKVILD